MDDKYVKLLKENTNIEEVYKQLAQKYCDRKDMLEKTDSKQIKELIERNGYLCRYNKSERFYKVVLIDGAYKIGYNVLIKYGLVDFILFIFKDGKCIDGGPVGWMFLNEDDRPRYPMSGFHTYEELEEILIPMFEVITSFDPVKVFDENK